MIEGTATPLVGYLENRQPRTEYHRGRKDLSLAGQPRYARDAEAKTLVLSEDVAVLLSWLRHDVLAVRGPDYARRCQL